MFTGQTGLLTTLRPECGLLRQCDACRRCGSTVSLTVCLVHQGKRSDVGACARSPVRLRPVRAIGAR